MISGVSMIAPETVFLSHDTVIGQDALIEPNVVFGPGSVDRWRRRHPCLLAHRRRACQRRRDGWALRAAAAGRRSGGGSKVGNFCEVKNGKIGEGAKVNHLTYIGDAKDRRRRQHRRGHDHLQL
jgi:bifunctional UDP-N-acetylglucosamine pyrophosphorylase/glucosamine-1-phosphate N-acetyltransferase